MTIQEKTFIERGTNKSIKRWIVKDGSKIVINESTLHQAAIQFKQYKLWKK